MVAAIEDFIEKTQRTSSEAALKSVFLASMKEEGCQTPSGTAPFAS